MHAFRGEKMADKKPELSFDPPKKKRKRKSLFGRILNWLLLVFAAAVFGYAVITFGVQTVQVVGPSMNTTLADGETVLVNKLYGTLIQPKRYDVIAFKQIDFGSYYEIKRVIGLPGETVQIKDGKVYINGEVLEDSPIEDKIRVAGLAEREIKLSKNEFFVLGDNVNNSEDSRYSNVGNVAKSEILGKVFYRIKPEKGKVN